MDYSNSPTLEELMQAASSHGGEAVLSDLSRGLSRLTLVASKGDVWIATDSKSPSWVCSEDELVDTIAWAVKIVEQGTKDKSNHRSETCQ